MMNPPEPDIIINGQRLNEAQAMTVRVAVQCFAISMSEDTKDRIARLRLRENYLNRIKEINGYMAANMQRQEDGAA